MNFVNINTLLLSSSLLSGIAADSSSLGQEKTNLRSLVDDPSPECVPLLKVTIFEGDVETFDVECQMSDTLEILPIIGLPDDVKAKFDTGEYQSGDTILKAPGARRNKKAFKITDAKSVSIVKKKKDKQSGRRMNIVSKKTLALWISAPDAQTSTPMDNGDPGCLTDEIFGTYGDNVNLRSQYAKCSGNQFSFDPADDSSSGEPVSNGVYAVDITQSVVGVDDSIVRNAANTAASNALGDLNSQYDHVMMCIPPGTSGSWIAYAYVNHWLSVYNNRWCNYVSAQLHEVGHNLNLAHSGEGSNEYADQSSMMGFSYSSDETPEMCFNAPKNFQLGWFPDREVTLSPSTYSWAGRLYGIANYDVTSSTEKMMIRMEDSNVNSGSDIYVSFNAQNGINAGTQEGGDQVLIHRKDGDVDAYGRSWLLSKMSAGATFQASMTDGTVPITVTSINTSTFPPYAEIQIGSGNSSPTSSPSSSPTRSPVASPVDSPTRSPVANLLPTSSPTKSPVSSPSDCDELERRDCRLDPFCEWVRNVGCTSIGGPVSPPTSPPVPPPQDCSSYWNRKRCNRDDDCRWSNHRDKCVQK